MHWIVGLSQQCSQVKELPGINVQVERFTVHSNLNYHVEQAGGKHTVRTVEEPRGMTQWLPIIVEVDCVSE